MVSFDDIVRSVNEVCPPFNNFALSTFVKDSINNSHEFPALVFREGCKLVPADVEFMDYTILSPEEQVKFELGSTPGKSNKPKVPLTVSHLQLVQYRIRFGKDYVLCRLYTPYIFDNMLFIKDKRTMIRKVILEQTLSRVRERDKDGVSVSPIRVNLTFNRKQTHRIVSYITGELYTQFLVCGRLYHGPIRRKICETTTVHYMLAKFGLLKTLKRFGLSKNDILFTESVGDDIDKFDYFAARPFAENVERGPGLFLKVKKTLLSDDQSLKFVVNMLYVLSFFDIQNIENLYAEHGSVWKITLGIIISEDRAELKAYSNAETHLQSVDYFIDPLTRDRFKRFGVMIEDIYDLLVYIFINIDSWMVNNLVHDLYNSRLDVSNGIHVGSYATKIFFNIYHLRKKTNIALSDVKSAFSFNPMMFKMMGGGKKDDSEHYVAPPDIVGDNFLFSGGLSKITMGGKAEQRLHPSMVVAESIGSFVGKQINKTGYVNPYIPTDENGAILHPDYARNSIDKILAYLPK